MFIKISIRSQFLLLALFLQEEIKGNYEKEFEELESHGYIDPDLNITKKGQAYCHVQNYVGVNFKSLIENNTRKANLTLATNLLIHINDKNSKDIIILTKKLPIDVQNRINQFFNNKYKKVAN